MNVQAYNTARVPVTGEGPGRLEPDWRSRVFGVVIDSGKYALNVTILLAFLTLLWIVTRAVESSAIDFVLAATCFVGLAIPVLVYLQLAAARRQRRLRLALRKYLPPEIVETLVGGKQASAVGCEPRDLSLLFTDIAGFTRLTERTPPDRLASLLNAYIGEACKIVEQHGGYVDKIVGDAIHAIFEQSENAKPHAQAAVNCALVLDRWSEDFRKRQAKSGVALGETRIGVNSGVCLIGSFGGPGRCDFTAHGDAINTTARLEAINKRLGTRVCVGKAAAERCEDIRFRPIGSLLVEGKGEPVEVLLPIDEQA